MPVCVRSCTPPRQASTGWRRLSRRPKLIIPTTNDTLYGGAKLFGEQLLSSFHSLHGLAGVSLRYFNVYGPRMDIHGRYTEVLVRWMQRIAAGEAPVIFGDGLQTLDMVFTEDVARANILAAEADVEAGIYNVGSGTEISLRELAKCLAEVMGRPDLAPAFAPARAVNPCLLYTSPSPRDRTRS